MSGTELVLDTFTGGNDSDIDGRIPDGGGDAGKAVGTWTRNPSSGGSGRIGILSGKAVQYAPEFNYNESIYVLTGVPGLTNDQYAEVHGSFPAVDTGDDNWFSALARFSNTDLTGLQMYLYDNGDFEIYFIFDGFYTIVTSGNIGPLTASFDYTLGFCVDANVMHLFVNGTDYCRIIGTSLAVNIGVSIMDAYGVGANPKISRVAGGLGCGATGAPEEPAGTGIWVRKNLVDREAISIWVRTNLEWREVTEISERKNLAWAPPVVPGATGGTGLSDCSIVDTGHPIYSIYRYSPTQIEGPDGAGIAEVVVDPTLGAITTRTALHSGAIMNALGPNGKLYAPGRLSSGINVVVPGTGVVASVATPSAPYGAAKRADLPYLKHYATMHLSQVVTESLSDVIVFWRDTSLTGAGTPGFHLTLGTVNFRGAIESGNFKLYGWSDCGTQHIGSSTVPFANFAPSSVSFPGKGDSSTSKYVCNYALIRCPDTSVSGAQSFSSEYGTIRSIKPGSGGFVRVLQAAQHSSVLSSCPLTPTGTADLTIVSFSDVDLWELLTANLYAGEAAGGDLWAIHEEDASLVDTIATGITSGTRGVVVDSTGNIIVCGGTHVKCYKFDDHSLLWSVTVGAGAHTIFKQGSRLWVSCETANEIAVIDTTSTTGSLTATIPVSAEPHDIALSDWTGEIYVACTGANVVDVIDPSTFTVDRSLPVQAEPWGIAYDPSAAVMWVSHIAGEALQAVS